MEKEEILLQIEREIIDERITSNIERIKGKLDCLFLLDEISEEEWRSRLNRLTELQIKNIKENG